jgi:nitroimidazol reductase NimA-like FMN-containing flavoprotein (pyridoxamine 5'-phosphate oxidase superfamily)
MQFEPEPMEHLIESECWTLLRSAQVGRLAVPMQSGGVDIFPVNHVVDQGSIVFRTALGSKLSGAIGAHEVAFEADGVDDDRAWSVVAHGRAELINRQTDLFESFGLSVRPWHLSHKPYFVRIEATSVTGRRFRIDPHLHEAHQGVSPWSST